MRVKERATELRQDRLNDFKKLRTVSKGNYETEKMAPLHHIGQQTVRASMLLVLPYEEKKSSLNECNNLFNE